MPRPGEKTRVLAEGSTATGYDGIRLGINIFDLGRINSSMLGMLRLAEKIDHVPIRFDLSRLDEGGVAFSCPLLDAACLCDVIRCHDRKAGDYPTRVYIFRKAWSRLPSHAVLTRVRENGDKCELNSEWFGTKEVPVFAPPKRKRVEI